jgi:translocation and assembly module TamA
MAPFGATAQDITFVAPSASKEERSTIRAASLALSLAEDPDAVSNAQDYIAAARADYARVVAVLYDKGYYSSVVSIQIDGQEAASLSPFDGRNQISEITYRIETGPMFTLGRANIGPLAPDTQLPPDFTTSGPAGVGTIRDAARAGATGWRNAGYPKARVGSQQINARQPDAQLDVNITLSPGPQLTFGRLGVEGNQDVRTGRIRRIAGLPAGEVYAPDEITAAATRLRRTGAFRSVALTEADGIGAGDTQDVTVQIVEQTPRRFGFGAEISSLEGLTLSSFWMHRNLLGGAERLRVEAEIAGIGGDTGGTDYSFATTFRRPAHFGTDTDLTALAQIEQLDEPSFFAKQVTLELGASRIVTDNLTAQISLGYRAALTRDGFGERKYQILTLPFDIEWDRRDDTLNATQGFYLSGELMPFLNLDGSADGARLMLDARYYRPVGERLVFALRGQAGSLIGPSISQAPSDFLFYSGGSGTVRGHGYQSLGVTTSGVETGGRSYLGASAEARFAVTDTIGIVGFYDYAMIGEDSTPGADGDSHAGAGLGLRYNTRFGPIRLDVASPVGGGNGGSLQVYVGIGQAF